MEFRLNEDQEMLRDMIREFAENEIVPIAAELDEQERFPEELIPQLGEMGVMGIPVPEEYGGTGMDYQSYVLAVEEISKVCASTGVTISAHTSLCCWPIEAFGTEEQKQKYLPGLASGELLGAFALTEPNAGTDSAMQMTTAVDKGDYYLLNGSKIFITNGYYGDVYVVFAMTDKAAGNKGISAFILEKGMEGFTFGKKERTMGSRGTAPSELIFDDVKVPKENLRHAGRRTDRYCSPGSRNRPGRHRRSGSLCKGTETVRPSHRRIPEYTVYSILHADKSGCSPASGLSGRCSQRCRRKIYLRSGNCQTFCRRDRKGCHLRSRSDVRRLRLYQGISRRENDAGRKDHRDL